MGLNGVGNGEDMGVEWGGWDWKMEIVWVKNGGDWNGMGGVGMDDYGHEAGALQVQNCLLRRLYNMY